MFRAEAMSLDETFALASDARLSTGCEGACAVGAFGEVCMGA